MCCFFTLANTRAAESFPSSMFCIQVAKPCSSLIRKTTMRWTRSDALVAERLNLGDGGKNTPTLRQGWYLGAEGNRITHVLQHPPQGTTRPCRCEVHSRRKSGVSGLRAASSSLLLGWYWRLNRISKSKRSGSPRLSWLLSTALCTFQSTIASSTALRTCGAEPRCTRVRTACLLSQRCGLQFSLPSTLFLWRQFGGMLNVAIGTWMRIVPRMVELVSRVSKSSVL